MLPVDRSERVIPGGLLTYRVMKHSDKMISASQTLCRNTITPQSRGNLADATYVDGLIRTKLISLPQCTTTVSTPCSSISKRRAFCISFNFQTYNETAHNTHLNEPTFHSSVGTRRSSIASCRTVCALRCKKKQQTPANSNTSSRLAVSEQSKHASNSWSSTQDGEQAGSDLYQRTGRVLTWVARVHRVLSTCTFRTTHDLHPRFGPRNESQCDKNNFIFVTQKPFFCIFLSNFCEIFWKSKI